MKIFSIAFALVLTVPSAAQDQSVLEEIQAEMANLREENQRIRAQLDQMNRARDPELDRLLRAQIGMAVDSAMQEAQADRRLTGGWNDGFFLASEDGKFSMEIGTLLQFRAIANHRPNPIEGGRSKYSKFHRSVWCRTHTFRLELVVMFISQRLNTLLISASHVS